MDPMILVTGGLAVLFALLALLQWRRAVDAEAQVAELEAKLSHGAPPPPPPPEEEEEEEEPAQDEEEDEDDEDDEDDEEEEEEEAAAKEPEAKQEPPPEPAPVVVAVPAPEPKPEPKKEPAPPPGPSAEDLLKKEAAKLVRDAYELARYLDFDAIVEQPAVYRVSVPITSANNKSMRYLKNGMFPCLKSIRIEGNQAILHVDTGKGAPPG